VSSGLDGGHGQIQIRMIRNCGTLLPRCQWGAEFVIGWAEESPTHVALAIPRYAPCEYGWTKLEKGEPPEND
jgi:hypothetical protein